LVEPFVQNTGLTKTGRNGLNSSKPRKRKGLKGNKTWKPNPMGRIVTQAKVTSSKDRARIRGKGTSTQGTRKANLRRRTTLGKLTTVSPLATGVGKNIRENVKLGQTFVSHVAKRAIFPRIVIPTPRIERIRINREFRISREPQDINLMQFKPRLTDPRFLREDWKLRNPKLVSMPILGEMQQLELPQW